MWPNLQFAVDLAILTEETLNEKLHFVCSVSRSENWTAFSCNKFEDQTFMW